MAAQFPMLGGFDEQQRKDFYSSPGFNPSSMNSALQSSGLSPAAGLADYNQLMGTNISPTQGASWLTGMNEGQMAQWMNKNPSQVASNAQAFGMGSNDVSSIYNNYYGTNVTPEQVQAYMAGNQGQTWMPTGVPTTQSYSSGGSSSGIDWNKSPVSFQYVQDQAAALPQMADDVGKVSYDRYAKMMRDALGDKGSFAGVLNNIGGRNLMGSSVASDALGNAALGIAKDIGNQAYQSDINTLLAKMNIPQILAQIAQLGMTSSSSNSSSSYSADPGAPERIIASLIASGW